MAMQPFLSNSFPSVPVISDEQRAKALKQTAELLREIDAIRRVLELPVEQFPLVIETYGKQVLALLAEAERKLAAERFTRLPMTMRSENHGRKPLKITAGDPVSVSVYPQTATFRVENLMIHGDPARWLVHDIKVGNQSQFVVIHGPTSGANFNSGGILEHLKLAALKSGMLFTVIVQYVGPEPEGEVFEATIVGMSTDF